MELTAAEPTKQTRHHYELAHMALREICFHDPYGFFDLIGSDGRAPFLTSLWGEICKNCDAQGAANFTIADVTVDTFRIGDFPAILIHMPPPGFVTEAYLVCIVLKIPLAMLEHSPPGPEVGYFVLEKGEQLGNNGDRTVFCAWDKDIHRNYGDGPPPEPAAMIAAVEEMLNG